MLSPDAINAWNEPYGAFDTDNDIVLTGTSAAKGHYLAFYLLYSYRIRLYNNTIGLSCYVIRGLLLSRLVDTVDLSVMIFDLCAEMIKLNCLGRFSHFFLQVIHPILYPSSMEQSMRRFYELWYLNAVRDFINH